MRNNFCFIVALIFLFTTCAPPAWADEPTKCTVPLSLTDPCVGVLLPPEAAAEGLRCLQVDLPRLKLDLVKERDLMKLRLDTVNLLLDQERIRATRIEGLLETSLQNQAPTPWYEHPVFWAVTGVVVGAVATIGIAYAVAPASR